MIARSMNYRATGLIGVLLASGLVLANLSGVSAASRRRPHREPPRVSNVQLREAIVVLQRTKLTLESADHDYGGHRAAAVKDIGAAQHQLKLALGTRHKGTKPGGKPGGKSGKGSEPQQLSNIQLAEAIPVLQRTASFLQKADHDYGGHRAQAVKDINLAIHQLKAALAFEKKIEK